MDILHPVEDGFIVFIATIFCYVKTNHASIVYGDGPKEFTTYYLTMNTLPSIGVSNGTVTSNFVSILNL